MFNSSGHNLRQIIREAERARGSGKREYGVVSPRMSQVKHNIGEGMKEYPGPIYLWSVVLADKPNGLVIS